MTTVAFQGEPGAFSEEAARRAFGDVADLLPCRWFPDVGRAVADGRADAAVLPVENSLAGSVQPAYDVLAGGTLRAVGEVVLPIRHALLGLPGATGGGLRRVLSHPVALAQCTGFLEARPEVEAVAVHDTAGAARMVAEGADPAVAAIAAPWAAERHGLRVLATDLQDRADNRTRFLAVVAGAGDAPPETDGRLKTVLMVETKHEPGALVGVLEPLAAEGVNLTKLESRPAEVPWTYRFFLEMEGSHGSTTAALGEIRRRAVSARWLGSFPVPAEAGATTLP